MAKRKEADDYHIFHSTYRLHMQWQHTLFCLALCTAALLRSLLLVGWGWVSLLLQSWGQVNQAIMKRCFHCAAFPCYDLCQENKRRKNKHETMNLLYRLSWKKPQLKSPRPELAPTGNCWAYVLVQTMLRSRGMWWWSMVCTRWMKFWSVILVI